MRRFIVLPNGRRCPLGAYAASWRALKGLPGTARITGWDYEPEQARAILADLNRGLHDRINRHIPGYGRGRKWDQDYQVNMRRDARAVNEYAAQRIVWPMNRLSTPDLQRRFQWSYSSADGVSVRLYSGRAA